MRRLLFLITILYFCHMPATHAATGPLYTLGAQIQHFFQLFSLSPAYATEETSTVQDSDQDGIPDHLDACPSIPHTSPTPETSNGCPDIPRSTHTQQAALELRPAPCAQAPCRIIIEQQSDLLPYIDCLFGVLTNAEGTLVLSKGARSCIES